MDLLKQKFHEKSAKLRTELRALIKANGNQVVGEVTLGQVFGGARGVKMMVWETSSLDAEKGIRFRGYSIPELRELLPKVPGGKEPLPEALFWLMLVGEIPTDEQTAWLSAEWRRQLMNTKPLRLSGPIILSFQDSGWKTVSKDITQFVLTNVTTTNHTYEPRHLSQSTAVATVVDETIVLVPRMGRIAYHDIGNTVVSMVKGMHD